MGRTGHVAIEVGKSMEYINSSFKAGYVNIRVLGWVTADGKCGREGVNCDEASGVHDDMEVMLVCVM